MDHPPKTPAQNPQGSLRAALARITNAQTAHQGDLAATLKKAAATQATEPNASLRAAIVRITKAQAAQQGDLAAALKKAATTQGTEPNAGLRAALAKITKAQAAQQGDLAEALKKAAATQATEPNASLRAALANLRNASAHECQPFDSIQAARWAGVRHGVQQLGAFDLNPWTEKPGLFEDQPVEALQQDWHRVEHDLWTAVEKLREKLNELPQPAREQLTSALVSYLRSNAST